MILSKSNIEELKKHGLELIVSKDEVLFLKKRKTKGNYIPEWRNDVTASVECPVIELTVKNDKFILHHWDWAPGPGPGDFRLTFDLESDIVSFLESYYFGENEYFEARKNYENLSRNSFNINEVKQILKGSLYALSNQFGKNEISYGERGAFHKIPIDNWRQTEYFEEHHEINVTTGFLPSEVTRLRKKIQEGEEFDYEDVNFASDLLFELSILLKSKTSGE